MEISKNRGFYYGTICLLAVNIFFPPTFSNAFERALGLDVVVQNFAAAAKGWLQKGD